MSAARLLAFIVLTLAAFAPFHAAAQDVAAGERLFRQRCGACHSVESGQNRVGPSLAGILGRKPGSIPEARYSQGMRDLGSPWDHAQLEQYLANPRGMVPNTTMTIAVPNASERNSIVAYLAWLNRTP